PSLSGLLGKSIISGVRSPISPELQLPPRRSTHSRRLDLQFSSSARRSSRSSISPTTNIWTRLSPRRRRLSKRSVNARRRKEHAPKLSASARNRPSATSKNSTVTSPSRNASARSEEHTSELQSRENLVCRLLLEKKKTKPENIARNHTT